MNIKQTIENINSELKEIYPTREITGFVSIIFEHLLNFSAIQLKMNVNQVLSPEKADRIQEIINRLKNEEPIQYIFGKAWFYDLVFEVNNKVLIPRQETEELVKWVIDEYSEKTEKQKILDIGTGSGCIITSVAANITKADFYAVDISEQALETALKNARNNKVIVDYFLHDILSFDLPLPKSKPEFYDIIISNPPYITEMQKKQMQKNVLNFEPELALFVEDRQPLAFYEALSDFAEKHLIRNGKIYMEINEKFGKNVEKVFLSKKFNNIVIRKDLNEKDRMICATRL